MTPRLIVQVGRGRRVRRAMLALRTREEHRGPADHQPLRPLHPWRDVAGSPAAAVALLPLLQNDYAQAAIIAPDDGRLLTERVSYESPKGRINGYLVRAKAMGICSSVIVIHENRGLN